MGSLPFLFVDDFEGSANISVAIKSGSTVSVTAGEAVSSSQWEAEYSHDQSQYCRMGC